MKRKLQSISANGILTTLVYLLAADSGLAAPEDFYTQRGNDKTFEEIMRSGDLKKGSTSRGGVEGSRINVNDALLRDFPYTRSKIPSAIHIHTLGNSHVRRPDFDKWSRWYQEDGNTQVFRLFEGETNVRNSRELAARIEAYSALSWQKGEWHEWSGVYTIIKPHGSAIFQAKNNENDWSVQLNMNDDGDVRLNHRRGDDKVIARNMVGKPFHIRVRDNGHDYQVFLNGKLEGEGSYARPVGQSNFRWGMYLGGNEVRHDAMIFVTGAMIDPPEIDPSKFDNLSEGPSEDETASAPESEPAVETPPPAGLPIPERTWTNKDGARIRAPAVYKVGDDFVSLKAETDWVTYMLEDLSSSDRKALMIAQDFAENP